MERFQTNGDLRYKEFLWAVGDEIAADTIKLLLKNKISA